MTRGFVKSSEVDLRAGGTSPRVTSSKPCVARYAAGYCQKRHTRLNLAILTVSAGTGEGRTMVLSDTGEARVHGYLFVLERSLKTFLPTEVVRDAVREIESHLRERIAAS